MEWNDPITLLKGVGEQREKKLNKLGIYTIEDLLTHYPREHKDHTQLAKVADLEMDVENTFLAKIKTEGVNGRQGRYVFTRLQVEDETGCVNVLWYNQPYMKSSLKLGEWYLFTGKLSKKYGRKEVLSPECERIGDQFAGGRIVPVYPSVEGISQKLLRNLVAEALVQMGVQEERLPLWMRQEFRLAERSFAIENIHFPKTEQAFFDARYRLVFEEFLLLQAALYALKREITTNNDGIVFKKKAALKKIVESLPFSMTNAQRRVLKEIENDMSQGKIMSRLVQGDVGSGKTAVAMAAAFWAIQNGYQTVMMAPTEVLARQHMNAFREIFVPLGVEVVMLTGTQTAKERREILERIADGRAQMIIGTHAVIQKNVSYAKLGLVITDEQHRFGVRQRGALSQKGGDPHVLVMTATPIPRTLALILYGDLDISIIDELPPGRQEIDTLAVTSRYYERIYTFLEKEIAQGRQAYVVCATIEESEKLEAQAVTTYAEKLRTRLKSCRVACVHGKQKAKEKQEIMDAFVRGEIDILIATTVIEVGIHVPNATIMMVENAERFGLAQLHQLRGRVGRGEEKSYCVLVSDSKAEIAKKRIKALTETSDGFVLSETDLKLRGPGEFFGTRQHGLPELKIANLYRDMEILLAAQTAVERLFEMDEMLTLDEHAQLKMSFVKIYGGKTLDI